MSWVSSSNLRSIWYHTGRHWLTVEFQGGRAYRYFGVPEAVYRALASAPSKGKYFYYNVRDKYAFLRIR